MSELRPLQNFSQVHHLHFWVDTLELPPLPLKLATQIIVATSGDHSQAVLKNKGLQEEEHRFDGKQEL